MSATANWRMEYDDFLDEFINSVGNDTAMSELEDITGAVFRNKSKLLGQLVAGLIETKYGHLLDEEYCACKQCNKRLKSVGKRSRKIETRVGAFELNRPYFIAGIANWVFPLWMKCCVYRIHPSSTIFRMWKPFYPVRCRMRPPKRPTSASRVMN